MATIAYKISTLNGTKALPAHTFDNDPDSGWYRQGAGAIRLSVDNTDVINATSSGIVIPGTLNITGTLTAAAGSFTTLAASGMLTVNGAINVFYRAVNSGNPEIHLGASATNDMFIQAVYNSSTQVINYITFKSRTTSATANAAEFRFQPDEVLILTIDDGGLEVIGGITVTTTLDATGLITATAGVANATSAKLSNTAEGNTGAVTQKTARQVVAMGTGATAVSTSISVPTGARLIAVALNVDVAIVNAGNNTWSAAFSTGSTTSIAPGGTAAAQNTKITLMLDDEITTGTTEITFTPQAANFTSGSIEAVVWYEEATALANA